MALTDNLISYWKLDEASGNATDSHGSNTLSDNNSVGTGTGIINGARDFESGSSQYLSHADNSDLSVTDQDFTFAAWIKLESNAGPVQTIISKGEVASGEYVLGVSEATDLQAYIQVYSAGFTHGSQRALTFGVLATGVWYFVVGWHDAVNNILGISVNDTADTGAYSTGSYDGTGIFHIGSFENYGNFFDGLIDEVGFWKRVLTSGERTQLYNAGAGLAYPFSGGGGTVIPVFMNQYRQRR